MVFPLNKGIQISMSHLNVYETTQSGSSITNRYFSVRFVEKQMASVSGSSSARGLISVSPIFNELSVTDFPLISVKDVHLPGLNFKPNEVAVSSMALRVLCVSRIDDPTMAISSAYAVVETLA
ncbi:hypothetical protein OUZ56_026689 [Daphnia magna]|uniref:Uncharacterized protein n=1 Tax=Daphnia magna TaxID=35525 RepID=A0ABQ9ZMM1_9CRUS|nr:hypothetical protein OUZ56_026689 [Daphnia magna]